MSGGQFVRCQSRRRSQCVSCSELTRNDWAAIGRSGVFDSEKLPVSGFRFYFLTLTAPSFGPVDEVGAARDEITNDYEGQVYWNQLSSGLWNATVSRLRRLMPTLEFFAVREVQKRGALHFHVTLRVEATDAWVPAPDVAAEARAARVANSLTSSFAMWGAQADCQEIGADADETAETIWYVSKALCYSLKDLDSGTGAKALEHHSRGRHRAAGTTCWSHASSSRKLRSFTERVS